MNDQTRGLILEHAKREYPREACGLILNVHGDEVYWPCRNLAENRKDFVMSPEDYAAGEDQGDVLAVVHSHPDTSANPSQADLVSCESTGLPWHIMSIPGESWRTIQPSGYRAPLIGREFSYGILDCFTLIRDWFREERDIHLMDFDRPEEWWNRGGDLYMENFSKAGFEPVNDEIQRGDVILMQIRAPVANHAAVYLGNNLMLHHLINRLSCREVYGGWWQKNTRLVVRYRGETP